MRAVKDAAAHSTVREMSVSCQFSLAIRLFFQNQDLGTLVMGFDGG
jgi:hypothetical protein